MAQRKCSIPSCDGLTGKNANGSSQGSGRGWCSKHYQRWQYHGDPLWEPPTTADQRWAKVRKLPNGCWEWTGPISPTGYGRVAGTERKTMAIHRWAYEQVKGPIPPESVIDHLCHGWDKSCPGGMTCPHRRCVNPDHLEAVTQSQNIRRARGPVADNAQKTHCLRGHPLSGDNLRIDGHGNRQCRECRRLYDQERKAIRQRRK